MHSFSFEAIGTYWTIDLTPNNQNPLKIEKEIKAKIEEFDKTYSRFRKDSYITKLSRNSGEYEMPVGFDELFTIYKTIHKATNGLFTPAVGTALNDAGYDSEYSLIPKKIRKVENLDSIIELKNRKIIIKKPVILDFGAAGKGYLVDIIKDILENLGVQKFTIDAGGDIYHKGEKIRIALEHPDDPKKAIGVAEIENQSICASSGNRRKWDKYHHILNPTTLESPKDVIASWVIADKTVLSDAIATALILFPHPDAFKDFKFEYVLLYKDYRAQKSNNFGELFIS